MPKRYRPRPHPEHWPEHARPLDPARFRQAALAATAAATTPHRLLHERVSPHMILTDTQEELRLTDTPINRVNLTIRDHFDDQAEYHSACWRFWAIGPLLEQPELAPWIGTREPDRVEIHDAVLAVAATAPLTAKGEFLVKPFCTALQRWTAEHPDP